MIIMPVLMAMIMPMSTTVIIILGMYLRMSRAFVFEPEFRDSVPDYASQRTQLS